MKFKTSIKSQVSFEKVHSVIKFTQETWLKTYITMNTQLRKNAKNNFGKEFFKFIKNAVFGKTMVRKHRDIKLVPTDGRKNYLVTKSNYQTKKMFQYNLLGVEMK